MSFRILQKLALQCLVVFIVIAAFFVPSHGGNIPEVGGMECFDITTGQPTTCGGGGNSDSGGGSGGGGIFNLLGNIVDKIEAAAEKRRKANRADAYQQNEQGNTEYSRGNYSEAVRLYSKAHSNSPNDPVIRQNLKNAEAAMERENQEQRHDEEKRREQAEFREQNRKIAAMMTPPKQLPKYKKTAGVSHLIPPMLPVNTEHAVAAEDAKVAAHLADQHSDGRSSSGNSTVIKIIGGQSVGEIEEYIDTKTGQLLEKGAAGRSELLVGYARVQAFVKERTPEWVDQGVYFVASRLIMPRTSLGQAAAKAGSIVKSTEYQALHKFKDSIEEFEKTFGKEFGFKSDADKVNALNEVYEDSNPRKKGDKQW